MTSKHLATPYQHPFSLVSLADKAWQFATESTIQSHWTSSLCGFAESAVASTFNKITEGQLIVRTPTEVYTFPASPEPSRQVDLKAEIQVLKPTFWLRLAAMSDVGFAEAYMFQEIDCEDLISVFLIFIRNRKQLSLSSGLLSSMIATISGTLTSSRFIGSLANTRSNISVHYDISNKMYAGFMSKDMNYSCAIFPDLDSDILTRSDGSACHIKQVEDHDMDKEDPL